MTEFVAITCCHSGCGTVFGLSVVQHRALRSSHERFFCPNGHGQSFTGKSVEETLRRQLNYAKQREARLEEEAAHARAVARGYKGHAAKLKKRIGAGTCPCCKRSFDNLRRHMANQHPGYGANDEAGPPAVRAL